MPEFYRLRFDLKLRRASTDFHNLFFSQAVLSGNTLYISGVLGLNPSSGKLVAGGAKEQATQIFKNMSEILKEAGGDFKNGAIIVSCYVIYISMKYEGYRGA